jgi:hypothetical protein
MSAQRELQDSLALKMLSADFHEGYTIRVDRGPEGFSFSTTEPVMEGEVMA